MEVNLSEEMIGFDIVSTSGEISEKFIRELHRVATYVKAMLFPIRGKIINAFKTSRANFFSNEEVQGITRIILGSDYKRGFDVKDCKVSKVIFMADADVDRIKRLSKNTFRNTMRVA